MTGQDKSVQKRLGRNGTVKGLSCLSFFRDRLRSLHCDKGSPWSIPFLGAGGE